MYGTEDIIIRDKKCVLRKWKNFFKSLYNDSDNIIADQIFTTQIKNDIISMEGCQEDPMYTNDRDLNCNITRQEIESIVIKAKNCKAVGIDLLP